MASGDNMQAAVNFLFSCAHSIFAGVHLQTIRTQYYKAIQFMEERKLVIFKVQSQYQQQTVFKLIGTDEDPKYVSTEEHNILGRNDSVRATFFFHTAYISFMFRSYDDMKVNIEKYLGCIRNTWANLLLAHAQHAFYVGLISFWLVRKSRDEHQWHQMGNKSKLALKKWTESSQWTFENKWYLLEAEESFCNNDLDAAKTYYDKAISSAKSHKVRGSEQTPIVSLHERRFRSSFTLSSFFVIFIVRARRSIGLRIGSVLLFKARRYQQVGRIFYARA